MRLESALIEVRVGVLGKCQTWFVSVEKSTPKGGMQLPIKGKKHLEQLAYRGGMTKKFFCRTEPKSLAGKIIRRINRMTILEAIHH